MDALAGSYYIEYLTDNTEEKVLEYLKKIEEMGGAVKCIERGYQQEEIARSAYEYAKQIESKEKIIVGVNRFDSEENTEKIKLLSIDDSLQKKQVELLNEVKKTRDNKRVSSNLNRLKEVIKKDENIIPYILECVESYCSIGEISDVLREIWGEHN